MKIFGISIDDITTFIEMYIDEHGHTTLKAAVIIISILLSKGLISKIIQTYKDVGKGKERTRLERMKYSIQFNYNRDENNDNSMYIKRYLRGRFICIILLVFIVFGTFVTTGEQFTYGTDGGLEVLVFEKKDENTYQYQRTKIYQHITSTGETSDDYAHWIEISLQNFQIQLDEKNQPTLVIDEYWEDRWDLSIVQSTNRNFSLFDKAKFTDNNSQLTSESVAQEEASFILKKMDEADTIELPCIKKTYSETTTQNYLFGIIQMEDEIEEITTRYTIYYSAQRGHSIY